jgi:uroporphyrin-III C-methyltransferase/precorrin-2 dehydrogenase/sirohydrochlorin ferrochelatase
MALQRVEALRDTGARVILISPDPALPAAIEGVSIERRAWRTDDFTGATVVFSAFADRAADERVAAAARAAGALVNVADRSDLCDFYMPAVVRRGAVSIAVSTDGASPALAARLRSQIEALLPARLGELAQFASSFRDTVKGLYATFAERQRFWHRFFDSPAAELVLAGDEVAARRVMMATLGAAQAAPPQGALYIVGAGPGNPDLLTLQALRLMQQADVVLHDDLVSADILARVRRDAEFIPVGKRLHNRGIGQDAIHALIVREAKAGKRVLRLKGGDPFVFGRGGEEAEHARAQGIEVTVAPGITAALGCAAAAGIPLTHRDAASAISFVTAHGREGEPRVDWTALAGARQTLAIYMGLSRAAETARHLVTAGLPGTTAAAIIENGTRPGQSATFGTLDDLALLAARHGDGPALMIIGEVVRRAPAWPYAEPSRRAVS